MVKLASTLPKEHERNGLEPNGRRLLDVYQSQDTIVIVALIRTKEVLSNEDFERIPKVEIVAVEPALTDTDAGVLRDLLTALHDQRVAHIKQPLDLPYTDEPTDSVVENPLAIEAGDIVDAEIVDDAALALTGKDA